MEEVEEEEGEKRKTSSSSGSNNYNTVGYYLVFEGGKLHCNFGEWE
jgi:hypothetical protein